MCNTSFYQQRRQSSIISTLPSLLLLILLLLSIWIDTTIAVSSSSSSSSSFLWLSDIHLDPYYGTSKAMKIVNQNCGNDSNNDDEEFPFGQIGCDSPLNLVQSAIDFASSFINNIEFIIITGDICRHGTDLLLPNNPINETIQIEKHVTKMLLDAFGDQLIPILITIGNNDVTPDYFIDDTTSINNEQLELILNGFDLLLTSDEEKITFAHGGYYSKNVTSKITILSLNTIIYSTLHEPPDNNENDPFGQFVWLQQQLDIAKKANRVVYIIGHIPPTIGSYRHSQMWKDQYLIQYYNLISKSTSSTSQQEHHHEDYSTIIKGQFFGHIHSDEFRIPIYDSSYISTSTSTTNDDTTNDDSADPTSYPSDSDADDNNINTTITRQQQHQLRSHDHSKDVILTASSITPIYGANPSIRVTHFDSKTGKVLDYDTYYMDLNNNNIAQQQDNQEEEDVNWIKTPSFCTSYGLKDMSRSSIEKGVVNKLQNDPNSPYWKIMLDRQHIYNPDSTTTSCNRICQKEWLCTLTSITKIQYEECIFTTYTTKNTFGIIGIGLLIVVFILMLLNFGCGWINPRRCIKRTGYQKTTNAVVSSANDEEIDGIEEKNMMKKTHNGYVREGNGQHHHHYNENCQQQLEEEDEQEMPEIPEIT